MIFVKKLRKTINGMEIVLLKKEIVEERLLVTEDNKNNEFLEHINSSIANLRLDLETTIEEIPDGIVERVLENVHNEITTPQDINILDEFLNDPTDGSMATYNSTQESLEWKPDVYPRVIEIENTLKTHENNFTSDHVITNKLHLPFAVKWPNPPYHEWGGAGKAGVFWLDPWDDPIDAFSIKMGLDDASIGETGYTFGTVDGLAMRFSNDQNQSAGDRGFVWTSHGGNVIPVMSLDTAINGGTLTVKKDIVTLAHLIVSGTQEVTDQIGHIHIPNFLPAGGTQYDPEPIITLPNIGTSYDGYAMVYEDIGGGGIGSIGLHPLDPSAGIILSGGATDGQILVWSNADSAWTAQTNVGGGGSSVITQDEGSTVDAGATTLNFVGAGVVASDAGSNVTTVTIGGGSTTTLMPRQVSGGTANQANSTFGAGYAGYHWFPGNLIIQNTDLYVNTSQTGDESIVHFHDETAFFLYNDVNSYFEFGEGGANSNIDLLISSGAVYSQGSMYTNNQLYLSNPHMVGQASDSNFSTGAGDDNVDGSGIWFGSGTSSENLTFGTGSSISASTNFTTTSKLRSNIGQLHMWEEGSSGPADGSQQIFFTDRTTGGTISYESGGWVTITPVTDAGGFHVSSGQSKMDQDLTIGNVLHVNLNNYLGSNSGGKILFHDGTTPSNESFGFITGNSRFELSTNTKVYGEMESSSVNSLGTISANTSVHIHDGLVFKNQPDGMADPLLKYDAGTDRFTFTSTGPYTPPLDVEIEQNLFVGGGVEVGDNVELGSTLVSAVSGTPSWWSGKEQHVHNVEVTGTGWNRIAIIPISVGRGEGEITLYSDGGSGTGAIPRSLTFNWMRGWDNDDSNISVIHNNFSADSYWSGIRIVTGGTAAYIDVNFASTFTDSGDGNLSMIETRKWGSSLLSLYGGTLSAYTEGDTIRQIPVGRFNVGEDFSVDSGGTVVISGDLDVDVVRATGGFILGAQNLDSRYIQTADGTFTTYFSNGGVPAATAVMLSQKLAGGTDIEYHTIASMPWPTDSEVDASIANAHVLTTHWGEDLESGFGIPAVAGTGSSVQLSVTDGVTAADVEWVYSIELSTKGTSTKNGAKYIAFYDDTISGDTLDGFVNPSGWTCYATSRNGDTSNHPELFFSGGDSSFHAYNNHPDAYALRYVVDAKQSLNLDYSSPQLFGAEYGWKRLGDTIRYDDGSVTVNDSFSATTYSGITNTQRLSIVDPTASEDITVMYTDRDITFQSMQTVVQGTGTPTVSWEMSYNSDRTDPGDPIIGTEVANNTTVGSGHTSFTTASIPAGNWIWLATTSTGGTTVDEYHITMRYLED